MIQMQSQRRREADERRPLPIFTFSICNLQSTIFSLVMSADAEVQASDIKMDTAVTTVGWSVRTITRCVVTAVSRTVRGNRVVAARDAVSRNSASTVVTSATGVAVSVTGVASAMTHVAVAAVVNVTTAVMHVSSARFGRWNQECQGGTREGDHQKAFHGSNPLGGDGRERLIDNAGGVPKRETSLKHGLYAFFGRINLTKCIQCDLRVPSFWCHPFASSCPRVVIR